MSLFCAVVNFGDRGPFNLVDLDSEVASEEVKSPLVLDLGMNECSSLVLGRDEETNGDTVCLG